MLTWNFIDDFFNFGDCHFACFAHWLVKISGSFSEEQVSSFISFPRFHKSKVAGDRLFHNVLSSVEYFRLARFGGDIDASIRIVLLNFNYRSLSKLINYFDGSAAVMNQSANTSRGVESRDASTASSNLLGESSLGS
jgi:hypothetical protein